MSVIDYKPPALKIQSSPGDRFQTILDKPLSTVVGLTLIVAVAFLNLADITTDKLQVGLDFQVIVKLGGIGLAAIYGFIGFITDKRVRDVIQTFPVFWIVIIVTMYFISAPTSLEPVVAFASTLSIVAVLLMTVRALVQIGIMPVLNAIFVGMALFNVFSWIVYLLWPDVGVLKEALPEGKFAYRMSGLAHSNVLGQYTGLTVVLGTIMGITYKKRSMGRIALVLIAFGALVNSLSRTSLVATVLALVIAYRKVLFRTRYLRRYFIVAVVGVVGLMVISTQVDVGAKIEQKLGLLSKSGDTDELTSATGRADIWAYAIRLLAKRPIIGYGAGSSKFYLVEYSQYTHNMILNVAFSTGIIGGGACLLMVLGRIRAMFTISHPLADGILMFIIINGFFENVVFSTIAGMPTMIWIMSLSWELMTDDPLLDSTTGEMKKQQIPEGNLKFSP